MYEAGLSVWEEEHRPHLGLLEMKVIAPSQDPRTTAQITTVLAIAKAQREAQEPRTETPIPSDADLARRFWQRFYAIDVHRNDRPHEDVTIPLVLDLIAEVRCHALDNPEPVRPTATVETERDEYRAALEQIAAWQVQDGDHKFGTILALRDLAATALRGERRESPTANPDCILHKRMLEEERNAHAHTKRLLEAARGHGRAVAQAADRMRVHEQKLDAVVRAARPFVDGLPTTRAWTPKECALSAAFAALETDCASAAESDDHGTCLRCDAPAIQDDPRRCAYHQARLHLENADGTYPLPTKATADSSGGLPSILPADTETLDDIFDELAWPLPSKEWFKKYIEACRAGARIEERDRCAFLVAENKDPKTTLDMILRPVTANPLPKEK
jgi:hypothetical protein